MNILAFIRQQPRLIAFGFFASLFSSFGQTFFISLSGAKIRGEYDLSHGDFGLVYMVGTLTSAALLIWAGRKIDEIDLRLYTALTLGGLALACLGMALVEHVVLLGLVIFGLRFTGQGLMSHISAVSIARYMERNRGKGLSIAAMGYAVGEAIFPTLVVAVIAIFGWRMLWGGSTLVLLLLLLPFLLWLLKGQKARHADHQQRQQTLAAAGRETGRSRAEVLRDPAFYVLLPSYLAMAFISTGFFFHQVHLTEAKGWSLSLFAGFFVIYAISQTLGALGTGVLVDRFTARRLLRFYLWPAGIAMAFLALVQAPWGGAAFMIFLALSAGATSVLHSAIWAEVYGTAHLGAIKAMGTSLMVFSTALSPPAMGLAIDAGLSMETIAAACGGYVVLASALIFLLFPRASRAVVTESI